MKTLAELNDRDSTWVWGGEYEARRTFAVGTSGRRASGEKIHLLVVNTVVAVLKGDRPRSFKVGDRFSINSICNGNGQFNGQVFERLDTADITCKTCLNRAAKRLKG